MAVNFSSGFNITSNEAVDQRIIKTKAEMRSMSPADLARMPDKYFCMCADDGQIYFYDKEGGLKPETGYFTAFDSTVADDIKNSEEVQSALTGNIVENIGENKGVQQSIASAISTNSDIQAQINQSVQGALDTGTVEVKAATNAKKGIVVGDATGKNKVSVKSDSTMEINSVGVEKLSNTEGVRLILNGGKAPVIG